MYVRNIKLSRTSHNIVKIALYPLQILVEWIENLSQVYITYMRIYLRGTRTGMSQQGLDIS